MRLLIVVLTAAAAASFAAPAFSQFGYSASSNKDGTTITFQAHVPMTMWAHPNAPYSATETSQTVQTLADGTHLTRPSMSGSVTYRDSQGRLRTERQLFPARAGILSPLSFILTQIQDPLAGYAYVLDSVNRVAHRMTLQAKGPAPAVTLPSPSGVETASDGTTLTTESLGTKTILGVEVSGRRTTAVHPIGSRMGNDRPVTSTTEIWMSPQLGLVVLSTNAGPGGNVSTNTLANLSTTEPDASLFQVPAGYQIVDETGPFTIKFPARN